MNGSFTACRQRSNYTENMRSVKSPSFVASSGQQGVLETYCIDWVLRGTIWSEVSPPPGHYALFYDKGTIIYSAAHLEAGHNKAFDWPVGEHWEAGNVGRAVIRVQHF